MLSKLDDDFWTPEEDDVVRRLGARFPGQWSYISNYLNKNTFIGGGLRSRSQCQERFQIIEPQVFFMCCEF